MPSSFILVDCTWSEFGEYSSCSVSCGQGIQTSVKLLDHTGQNGGKPCEEDSNILESLDSRAVATILRGLADAADNWGHNEL